MHCRDGSVQNQWGAAEPWALHGIVGMLLHRETLYVLSANAQLYRVPVAGGRTSPPVSLKVCSWQCAQRLAAPYVSLVEKDAHKHSYTEVGSHTAGHSSTS